LGVAALERAGQATYDAYGDVGLWLQVSVAAGGGYHGAMYRGDALGAGREVHLFFGLPLPVPSGGDSFTVIEPIVRVTRLYSATGEETMVQGGVQLRFATPAASLGHRS
jgi:hypothetical protein